MSKRQSVLFLTKYSRQGASSRLRSFQYIPELQDSGMDISVSSLFDDRYLEHLYSEGRRPVVRSVWAYLRRLFLVLFASYKYDLVWIEKELFPYFPAFFEWLFARLGKPYVVDYDDAVFHNYDLSSNAVIRGLFGNKIDAVMRSASCVVAGNEYLAARARAAGANRVEIIPTVVDTSRYQSRTKTKKGASLVVGWIGSPTTQKYVEQLRPMLQDLAHECDFTLMLVGATADIKDSLPGINVCIESWSEDTEAALIQKMDIGIMPLEDGPWEKGKCGYKLIQYMASSVPVVASPVGVNNEIVNGAGCGLLAEDYPEWKSALLMLLNSEETRHRFGVSGRIAVENHYSIQSQFGKIENCFFGQETQ